MKQLMKNIMDTLSEAALLEMGVAPASTAEPRHAAAYEPRVNPLKRFFRSVTNALADAAVLEMGGQIARPLAKAGEARETLEENLIEVAFAEAADYDDIHKAILQEHESERVIVRPDECQYGDNDLCFRHAA